MKKTLLLCLAMVISIVASAQDIFAVSDIIVKPGEYWFQMHAKLLKENVYTAFQMDMEVPEGMKVSISGRVDDEGNDIPAIHLIGNDTHVISANEYETGKFRIIAYSTENAALNMGVYPYLYPSLFYIDFDVLDNLTENSVQEIKFSNISFTDSMAVDHEFDDFACRVYYGDYYRISLSTDTIEGRVEYLQGGEEEPLKVNEIVEVKATPKPGYEFVCWNIYNEDTGEVTYVYENPYMFSVTNNCRIWASFSKILYDVVFDVDGVKTTRKYQYGDVITPIDDPKKEGYTFTGWSPAFVEGATVPIGGITYTAQWKINTYKVTYIVDGDEYKTIDVVYGESIPRENEPTKEGYIFSGWSEIPATMPANDVVITGSFVFDYNTDTYKRLNSQIGELQSSLNDAKESINNDCKDVASQFTGQINSIQKSIDALKADLEDKYKNVELTAESSIDTSAITAAIEKLKTDAAAAQKAYEEQKAEEEAEAAKKQANEAAYTKLSVQIAEVQKALDAAKTTIDNEYKDVASQFTEQISLIQNSINSLKADLKKKYDNVELNAESTIDTSVITASITKLLSDAKAAQELFEAGEAAKLANEVAYSKLSQQLSNAQSTLDAAKTTINSDCKDVAAQFAKTIADIQKSIDALKADLEAKYKNVELTAESTIDTSAISSAIEKLKTDAVAAQKAYEEEAEEAKKQANETAYTKLSAQIAEVQKALDAAKTTINNDCKDVVANYTSTIADIQKSINELKADLEAKYKNVELTAESTIDTSAISSAIEKLKTDAAAAQKAYEEQKAEEEAEAAKKQANEAAYTKLSAQIDEMQKALDAAKTTINNDCKDVAADYAATIADIQKSIDALKTDLEAKYKKVELTAESIIDTSTITAAIEKLKTDAAAAQKAYDESVGIDSVRGDGLRVKAVYSITGQKVEEPKSGMLYIFVYENGKTVKKVMK